MLVLRWREEAIEDLAEIIDYIDARDPVAADRLHADIAATAELFAERQERDGSPAPAKLW